MTELRRDPIVGRWVIVEKEETSLTPQAYEHEDHTRRQAEICQFCPGREKQTPPEVDVLRDHGSAANGPGWTVRVVPNKFPALKIEGDLDKRGDGIYDMSNGVGAHEVVIETPDHFRDLADLSLEEMTRVLRVYQNRSVSLSRDRRFKYVLIFKNYGASAGTSVEHAHSQIIALPMVPKSVLEKLEGARNYYKFRERCVYCDLLQQEYDDKDKIVTENDAFMAFCPFAPRYPFETWIFPKAHHSEFNALDDKERQSLAGVLWEMLNRIKACLRDPSYNFYLHISPVNYEHEQSFHWHIEIVPQLTREAGYEWGTAFYLVQTNPAVAARFLREVVIK